MRDKTNRLSELEDKLYETVALNEQLAIENRHLAEQVEVLLNRLYGKKSEQIDPNQLQLFATGTLAELEAESPKIQTPVERKPSKPRGHGRNRFPAHLARQRIECEVPEGERICKCGEAMVRIGEDVNERGHVVPSRIVVKQYVRAKYACPKGHAVKTAEAPPALIDKCKYEPSVYAHIATSKYGDHQPLNRLEGILKRQGLHLPRSTMWDMLKRIEELVANPVVKQMKAELLDGRIISADETPIDVIVEGQKGTKTGYLWAYRRGDIVVFDFTMTRGRDGPKRFLGKWRGTLQIDGYSGYDEVIRNNEITRAGCWAHARRKFKESMDSARSSSARVMLLIARLYRIESALRKRAKRNGLSTQELHVLRFDVRRRRSRTILSRIEDLVDDLQGLRDVLPKSMLGKALGYARNQRQSLRQFLSDGELEIDNNACERAMRPIAMGRRNWLFTGSPRGGRCAAQLYSLVTACKALKIDPEAYLEDVLSRAGSTPASDVASLTPWAWAANQPALLTS